MDTFEAIEQRRSVKYFDPQHKFTDKEKKELLRLALLTPTSFNIQNYRLVVVEDPALRQKLKEAAWNQAQVTEASLLIIICADLNAWDRDPKRYWQNAPPDVQEKMSSLIIKFYKDDKQLQHDEAMRSTGLIAQTLMLTAKAMGYDSCPMVGFDFAKVAKIINLPKDHVVSMLVVVGKALQPPRPRAGQLPVEELIRKNTF